MGSELNQIERKENRRKGKRSELKAMESTGWEG